MKLVIVKSDNPIPKLYVASAVSYDITSNIITLNREVPMAGGPATFAPAKGYALVNAQIH